MRSIGGHGRSMAEASQRQRAFEMADAHGQ
jgi:hypothetical protein